MLGVIFLGNKKMELGEIPDPNVREGDVLIRVKASAICGSEMETFVPPRGLPWKGNPGHEVMGIIEDPNGSKRFRKGDRIGVSTLQGCENCFWCLQGKQIFCKQVRGIRNAHSEYVVSKEIWLHPLDDDITDGVAVLLSGDGMGVPYGASIKSGVAPGDITCVFGTGPVGLGMTLFQTYLGAKVIAVDINPLALERAKQLGAWKTINPKETTDLKTAIYDLTFGLGPNKSFDAISMGNQDLFHTMLDVTMPGGTVVTVAHGDHGIDHVRERLSFHLNPAQREIWGRNLTVMGNWMCNFSDWSDMVALVRDGFQIDRIITNHFPIEAADEAYRRVSEGLEGKVILTH